MSSRTANIVELFSSVQGEGVLVGRRQAFLRFSGCNLHCNYCDTIHEAADSCNIELTPGGRDFQPVRNPVYLETIVNRLNDWKRKSPFLHHSLSITGGEPLLYSEILTEWLPVLRTVFPIFLETNGLLHEQLRAVIDHVDMISMDIKLPSTAGHQDLWQQHSAFLEIAHQIPCYVKMVVGMETGTDEVEKASGIIEAINRTTPLILQPVTRQLAEPGIGAHLLTLQQIAARLLEDVRIIPQTHALLRVL